ncbi:unnamed protein product [Rotaria sp. Silwood2]|nr:unnamed protein product [Rotaria sp. Silwood2]
MPDKEILSSDVELVNSSTISLSSKSQHLFWRKTSSADEVHDSQILPSTIVETLVDALTQKLGLVSSYVQLSHCVSHMKLVDKYRTLSFYGLEAGQIIDVAIDPTATRIICIVLSSGKILEFDVVIESRMRELKKMIQDYTGIDISYQVILKDDRALVDDEIISDCRGDSNGPLNVNFVLNGSLILDPSIFASNFNYNHTIPYDELHGGKQIVFNVQSRYETNDCWLRIIGTAAGVLFEN